MLAGLTHRAEHALLVAQLGQPQHMSLPLRPMARGERCAEVKGDYAGVF